MWKQIQELTRDGQTASFQNVIENMDNYLPFSALSNVTVRSVIYAYDY